MTPVIKSDMDQSGSYDFPLVVTVGPLSVLPFEFCNGVWAKMMADMYNYSDTLSEL